MTNHILTVTDAVALAQIINAATTGSRVARVLDGGEREVYGTARSICDRNGGRIGSDIDVRDGHLRVTSLTGWEHFWPVAELVREVHDGFFAPDYAGPVS